MKYTVLLFYKYTHIEDPEALRLAQLDLCTRLKIKGRIIIAKEGINATLEGEDAAVATYLETFLKDPRFTETHIKKSEGDGKTFPRLSVKVRPEIVSLKLGNEDINPNEITGIHLKPKELHAWLNDKNKKFTIIDMRNDYEHRVGKFKDSAVTTMRNFRDLPNVMDQIDHLKNETVVTVCTGGVRCEKASGYLLKKGFKDVYQLDGGIVSYMEEFKNDDFQGQLYVFDDRVLMTYTPEDKRTIIGRCDKCQGASEAYINCENLECHAHMIECQPCRDKDGGAFCGEACKEKVLAAKEAGLQE